MSDQESAASQLTGLSANESFSTFVRRPLLRIAANYTSTDGLIPESMEIEIDTESTHPCDLLAAAVQALAAVPANRYHSVRSGMEAA